MSTLTTTDEREAKLPRWVQNELDRLRRNLDDAHKTIRALTAGPDDTNTFAEPYRDDPLPLRRDAHIRFRFSGDEYGDRVYIGARIERTREGEYVEIQGSDMLSVRPQSGNVVQVWLVQR